MHNATFFVATSYEGHSNSRLHTASYNIFYGTVRQENIVVWVIIRLDNINDMMKLYIDILSDSFNLVDLGSLYLIKGKNTKMLSRFDLCLFSTVFD